MSDRERWRFACHEAGHAVGAIALGGRCNGLLLHLDGGSAFVDEVFSDREAYMVAAGPAAERLASEFSVPSCKPISLDEVADNPPTTCDQCFALATSLANVSGLNRRGDSDDRRLAIWACTGNASEPDTWVRRLEFAKSVAAEIVEQNSTAIVRIARELYQLGALSGPEINSLYEGQNA